MNRLVLIRIHMLLAAFMFPVALMFLVTGGLYTWEFKGSYVTPSELIELTEPLVNDAGALTSIVQAALDERGAAYPSGSGKVKAGGTSFKFEWTGAARDVELEPTAEPLVARLTIKETTWYRNLVQLHKAKGGQLFKVYAAGLAVSLFLILLSGFIMAWQVPRFRAQTAVVSTCGVVLFLVMVSLS